MSNEDDKSKRDAERLTPQSMHPLDPEEALRGFMQVDPEKVREAERRRKKGRNDDEETA